MECWTSTPVLSHQTTPSYSYGLQLYEMLCFLDPGEGQHAPLRGLESTASRIYSLCCAGLLFEALECFLLRSWLSRLLRHPARRAEWAYSYLLPGPTQGSKAPGSTLGKVAKPLLSSLTPVPPGCPSSGLENTASRIEGQHSTGSISCAVLAFSSRLWSASS